MRLPKRYRDLIALLNSIGNLGSFVGPCIVCWLKRTAARYDASPYFLTSGAVVVTLITFGDKRRAAVIVGTAVLSKGRVW